MTFIALTPTLSQREREILETVLYFPRPLGEGYRVREFVLRSHSFYEFWDSFLFLRTTRPRVFSKRPMNSWVSSRRRSCVVYCLFQGCDEAPCNNHLCDLSLMIAEYMDSTGQIAHETRADPSP